MLNNIAIKSSEVLFAGEFGICGELPPFRGATLRGALGYHLRKTVCNDLKRQCSECFLSQDCAYSNFFEGVQPPNRSFMKLYPKVPQPFMLIIDQKNSTEIKKGQPFEFSLKIFGEAANFFPYVAYAFLEAGEKGIGKDKILYSMNKISENDSVLYQNGSSILKKPKPVKIEISTHRKSVDMKINFLTPVRIRKEGHTASDVNFKNIITTALRRISAINYFYGSGKPIDIKVVNNLIQLSEKVNKIDDSTEIFSFDRYSGRQLRKIKLDGITGSLTFGTVPSQLFNVLKFAEKIGLGKSTSFGFGRIKLEVL